MRAWKLWNLTERIVMAVAVAGGVTYAASGIGSGESAWTWIWGVYVAAWALKSAFQECRLYGRRTSLQRWQDALTAAGRRQDEYAAVQLIREQRLAFWERIYRECHHRDCPGRQPRGEHPYPEMIP